MHFTQDPNFLAQRRHYQPDDLWPTAPEKKSIIQPNRTEPNQIQREIQRSSRTPRNRSTLRPRHWAVLRFASIKEGSAGRYLETIPQLHGFCAVRNCRDCTDSEKTRIKQFRHRKSSADGAVMLIVVVPHRRCASRPFCFSHEIFT